MSATNFLGPLWDFHFILFYVVSEDDVGEKLINVNVYLLYLISLLYMTISMCKMLTVFAYTLLINENIIIRHSYNVAYLI